MPTGRSRNDDIGKAGRMAPAACEIGQGAGDFSCRAVEGQDAIGIEMQHGSQPG